MISLLHLSQSRYTKCQDKLKLPPFCNRSTSFPCWFQLYRCSVSSLFYMQSSHSTWLTVLDLACMHSLPVVNWRFLVINGRCWSMKKEHTFQKSLGMASSEMNYSFGWVAPICSWLVYIAYFSVNRHSNISSAPPVPWRKRWGQPDLGTLAYMGWLVSLWLSWHI